MQISGKENSKNWTRFKICCYRTRAFKIQVCNADNEKKRKRTPYYHNHSDRSRKQKKQHGGFHKVALKRATKFALGVIKVATSDINNILGYRINQIISQGGKEIGRVLPKILRGPIEEHHSDFWKTLGENNSTILREK